MNALKPSIRRQNSNDSRGHSFSGSIDFQTQSAARHIESFLEMLAAERGAARNTLLAYRRDLDDFASFCAGRGYAACAADREILSAYLNCLAAQGLAASSAARRLSCLRQFHRFLLRDGVRADDPTDLLDSPRLEKPLPKYLTEAEVTALLEAASNLPGRRGKLASAALEILYSTGLRVSEMLGLRRTALAAAGDMLFVRGKGGRERIVPLSDAARAAAAALCAESPESVWLFAGRNPRHALTRQGFDTSQLTTFPSTRKSFMLENVAAMLLPDFGSATKTPPACHWA